jgi:adenylate cyclase
VAVLPLVNMSPDAENAFFADGVHEEILTQLSMMGDIKMISRTSVMGYANQEHNLRAIAAELHATHIVEGSERRAGQQVRITAQLIDAATDQHLWAQNFDRRLEDIFQVQSDVAAQIAAALGNNERHHRRLHGSLRRRAGAGEHRHRGNTTHLRERS